MNKHRLKYRMHHKERLFQLISKKLAYLSRWFNDDKGEWNLPSSVEERKIRRCTIHPDLRLNDEAWFAVMKEHLLWEAYIDENRLDWDKNLEMGEWSWKECEEHLGGTGELDWIENSDYFIVREGESPQPSWMVLVYKENRVETFNVSLVRTEDTLLEMIL